MSNDSASVPDPAAAAWFARRFAVTRTTAAPFFAADLFRTRFGADFPVPPPDPEGRRRWHQYVAFVRTEDGRFEVVGFCNWVRYGDVYLEGGMCVDAGAYRRMAPELFHAIRDRGGIAQLMMEHAATELDDCDAWFGYCGDRKAWLVDQRFGYERTAHPYVIVKWFRDVDPARRQALIDEITKLGPF